MSSQREFSTPKGTKIPLLNLKGKEYLEVKYRLVWFREDHPDWSIETQVVSQTEKACLCKAKIKDQTGKILATSHKFESVQGFPDFVEKSETGAIGRALALLGYGTQFCADELDEGERIVDSPIKKGPAPMPVVKPAEADEKTKKPSQLESLRKYFLAKNVSMERVCKRYGVDNIYKLTKENISDLREVAENIRQGIPLREFFPVPNMALENQEKG